MTNSRRTTLLVAQSGGCTAAINASLAGVVDESVHRGVPAVIGARFGVDGILKEDFVDLLAQPAALWEVIRTTPSAALGSCRRKVSAEDVRRILEVCRLRDVRYLLYIGGNDSADTALKVQAAAREQSYDLQVLSVPKTIDNDLPGTDHCPGYGSAARFIAQTTQDAGLDTEAMRHSDPLKIIEVMGRDAGWLAAASTLGKREERDAPHVICVPERAVDPESFVSAMEYAYRQYGFAVAVIAETVRDSSGRPLGAANPAAAADAFGHPTLAGAAQALTHLLGSTLGVKARFDKPGTLQRMCMALASTVDLDEAFEAGRHAVASALRGAGGMMVSINRVGNHPYRCEMQLVDLAVVANQHRMVPKEFLGLGPFEIAPAFAAYARPLIGPPLLDYARLL